MADLSIPRQRLLDNARPHLERELEANAFKGDNWRDGDANLLDRDVLYHALKLSLAVRDKDTEAIRELAADVANCALIVGDKFRVFDTDPPAIQPRESGDYDEDRESDPGSRYGGADLKVFTRDVQTRVRSVRRRVGETRQRVFGF